MYNVLKLQAPFERVKIYNNSPDVNLRKAIIMQAIIDATNISNEKEDKRIEQDAKLWLFGNSKHFKETCLEGELEPSFVIKIAKELIALHKNKLNKLPLKDRLKSKICKFNAQSSTINKVNFMSESYVA